MNNGKIDLHIHTSYSDGKFTPEQVIEYSHKKGLSAIAITDHDTTDGLPEAIKVAKRCGIEVVPAVELSCIPVNPFEEEIHLLGYYIHWEDECFQEKLKLLRKAREKRAEKMLGKFSRLGIQINPEALFKIAAKGCIGRPHFARILVKMGVVDSEKEAFNRYLASGKPAYVPKLMLSAEEGLQLIQRIGGIPVLAHPWLGANRLGTIQRLMRAGLKGIEVYHPKQSGQPAIRFKNIAEKYGLLVTGGSDCHGPTDNQSPLIGTLNIPHKLLDELKQYYQSITNRKIF